MLFKITSNYLEDFYFPQLCLTSIICSITTVIHSFTAITMLCTPLYSAAFNVIPYFNQNKVINTLRLFKKLSIYYYLLFRKEKSSKSVNFTFINIKENINRKFNIKPFALWLAFTLVLAPFNCIQWPYQTHMLDKYVSKTLVFSYQFAFQIKMSSFSVSVVHICCTTVRPS